MLLSEYQVIQAKEWWLSPIISVSKWWSNIFVINKLCIVKHTELLLRVPNPMGHLGQQIPPIHMLHSQIFMLINEVLIILTMQSIKSKTKPYKKKTLSWGDLFLKSFNLWHPLLMITLYHQIKISISFWYRRRLNSRSLIQP